MNALTLAAAFGILILIFQDGRFESLLGYTSQRALDLTIPLVLAALVFAISTDYRVFLFSRVGEARISGQNDRRAIAGSVAIVGRIVTAAAILFALSIGAFGCGCRKLGFGWSSNEGRPVVHRPTVSTTTKEASGSANRGTTRIGKPRHDQVLARA